MSEEHRRDRRVPLEVYGPSGITAMTTHLLEAYRADFDTRMKDRHLYARADPQGHAEIDV